MKKAIHRRIHKGVWNKIVKTRQTSPKIINLDNQNQHDTHLRENVVYSQRILTTLF